MNLHVHVSRSTTNFATFAEALAWINDPANEEELREDQDSDFETYAEFEGSRRPFAGRGGPAEGRGRYRPVAPGRCDYVCLQCRLL